MFSHDNPIISRDQDLLNRKDFSSALAQAILAYDISESLVIGLEGKWGFGKTSVINMVIENLEQIKSEESFEMPIIVKFNPWNFSDQNNLLYQMFRCIAKEIKLIEVKKVSSKIEKAGEVVSAFGNIPSLSPLLKPIADFLMKYAKVLKGDDEENSYLLDIKTQISEELHKIKNKLIIIIDDIDRLNKIEIRQIFQAVKSLGNFPNTIYLLSFDREIIIEALEGIQTKKPKDYLEKIVQISISLPAIDKYEIMQVFTKKFEDIIKEYPQYRINKEYLIYIFERSVRPFLKNFRDVNRLINLFAFKFYLIGNETNVADLLAITSIEVFVPQIYRWIHEEIKIMFDPINELMGRENINKKYYIDLITPLADGYPPNTILEAIQTIFPQISKSCGDYSQFDDTNRNLLRDQRIASSEKFSLYFSLSPNSLSISRKFIDFILLEATEKYIITDEAILNYSLLDELYSNLDRVNKERVFVILQILMNSYEQLITIKDAGLFAPKSDEYIQMMVRQLLIKISPEERLEFFKKDLSKYSKNIIFLFLDIIKVEEKIYGRWNFKKINAYGEPLFTAERLKLAENSVLNLIIEYADEHNIFDFNFDKFQYFCSIWEKLIDEIPIKYIIDKMNCEKNIVLLVTSKITHKIPEGVHYGNEVKWLIDKRGIKKYVTLKKAKEMILNLESSGEFESLEEKVKYRIAIFKLFCKKKVTSDDKNLVWDRDVKKMLGIKDEP